MAYQALYRKWRPRSFDSVIGQAAITDTLKNAIKNHTVSHAFLFAGPRGTGKTSCAKIFAKALNCLDLKDGEPCNQCENCVAADHGSMPDIMEIDAASNNGVDEIREIRDKVKYAPTQGKYKVYIIDEVHMLSMGAFNALLKTLEEPPEHVVFILATTELQKVPATIISRTQRYNFKRISQNDLIKRMQFILDQEQIKYEDKALSVIAQVADGGMRDSLSILDQLLSYEKGIVNYEDALKVTGYASQKEIEELLLAICEQKADQALVLSQKLLADGASSKNILDELIDLATNSLLTKQNASENIHFLLEDFAEKIKQIPVNKFFNLIKLANGALTDLRYTNQQQIPLEVFLVQASQEKAEIIPKAEVKTEKVSPSADMSAELAALKKQVVALTQQVKTLMQNPRAVSEDQVFTLDQLKKTSPKKKEPVKTEVKKPHKAIKTGNEENKKQVYQALEKATRADLNKIKDVWPDLQSVLAVSERAVLDVLEPVAASPNQVVMKCKYTLWFEKTSQDGDLLEKLTAYIEKFTKNSYKIVLVPDSDWLSVRKEFVESHKKELLAKKQEKLAAIDNEENDQVDEKQAKVIDKAKDLFGDMVNIKD